VQNDQASAMQTCIYKRCSTQRKQSKGPGVIVPTRNGELFRWCLNNGIRIVQPMALMTMVFSSSIQNVPRPENTYRPTQRLGRGHSLLLSIIQTFPFRAVAIHRHIGQGDGFKSSWRLFAIAHGTKLGPVPLSVADAMP
jgi:hypothetical protein